ncbi:queuosine precursor transporter [Legionella lytica]|uniref:Queuosine precursor transporter n=1 Tax=Legionella lytica TaxID=96232 RepID=A0ABW8DBJ3_9GAMM
MFDNELLFSNSAQPKSHFKYKYLIFTLFSASWLTSCVAAVKLVSIFGITLTGGFIIFPLTSISSTILVEIYGFKNARQAAWCGLLLNIFFVFFIFFVGLIPSSPHWGLQSEYNHILLQSSRIIFASIVSFVISFFLNAYYISTMKIKCEGKNLPKRILISNTIANTVDITCFISLAFLGAVPFNVYCQLLLAASIKKFLCEIILLPIAWYLIDKIKIHEGIEIFDLKTNYNPFSLENVYELNAYRETKITKKVM